MDIKKIAKAPVNFVAAHKVGFAYVAGVTVSTVISSVVYGALLNQRDEFIVSEGLAEKFLASTLNQD